MSPDPNFISLIFTQQPNFFCVISLFFKLRLIVNLATTDEKCFLNSGKKIFFFCKIAFDLISAVTASVCLSVPVF